MSLDTAGPLNYLYTLLQGLSGIQTVYKGAPANIGNKVAAYVTLAGQKPIRKADSVIMRTAEYFVGFTYRVDGAPDTAEAEIAALLDEFEAVLFNDLTLGGHSQQTDLDFSLSRDPRYHLFGGTEFRVYPVIICVRQYGTFKAIVS